MERQRALINLLIVVGLFLIPLGAPSAQAQWLPASGAPPRSDTDYYRSRPSVPPGWTTMRDLANATAESASSLHVITTDPSANEVASPVDSIIIANLDGSLDTSSVAPTSFVAQGTYGGRASGTFSFPHPDVLVLDPSREFFEGEVVRISATEAISSTDGGLLAPYQWQFTAGTVSNRCVSGFTDTDSGLASVFRGTTAWGDYDADGDLDILLTGWTGSEAVTALYENIGAGGFSPVPSAVLAAVNRGMSAWGDYDNDGYPDILLTGTPDDANYTGNLSKVYHNNGDGTFTDIWRGARWSDHGLGRLGRLRQRR